MNLGLHFVTYIRIASGHCHVRFPYKEILSFVGHCHVRFPNMEPLSHFGRFVHKVKLSCFSESFARKTTQQSNGSYNVTSDTQLFAEHSENCLIISANTYKKHFVCNDYCVAFHTDKTCSVSNCNFTIYSFETLKSYKRSWIHFASPINTWLFCIHFSSFDSVENLLRRVDKVW